MWIQDILAALEGWNPNVLISEIQAVYDGILIKTTNGKSYIYNHNTQEMRELGNWKRGMEGGE